MAAMSKGSASALCLAAAALLALGVQPATAAKKKPADLGKLKTATASATTTNDGQAVSVTATCPDKTKAVGGGFDAPIATDMGALSSFHTVTESRRASGNSWRVNATRFDANPVGPALVVTAEVYCRSGAGKIAERSDTDSALDPTSYFTAVAACPLGRALVGGGFQYSAGPQEVPLLMSQNRPSGTVAWVASGVGLAPGSQTLSAHAYCRKGPGAVRLRTGTAALPTTDTAVASAVTAPCPGKLQPFAGGYRSPGLGGSSALAVHTESRRAGKSWRTSAINISDPDPGQLSSFALCS